MKTHGQSKTRMYTIWDGMIQRCHNPNNAGYTKYGYRGITVCQEWRDSFEVFLRDVGEPWFDKAQLDRIDNDKGYFPGNVRWASSSENNFNRRPQLHGKMETFGFKSPRSAAEVVHPHYAVTVDDIGGDDPNRAAAIDEILSRVKSKATEEPR